MAEKPTYEELEQRIENLESDLAASKKQNSGVRLWKQYLQAILDNANIPIFLKDADNKYLLINREFERVLSVTADQVLDKNDYDLFPEPIANLFRTQDEEVKQRKNLVNFVETLDLAIGERTFITAKFPLFNEQGDIYAIGGVCTDITELQQVQQELKASEHKFRSILESCPEGIHMYTLQPDGRLIFTGANPAADTILKMDHKQFIGRTIEETFPAIADTEVPDRYREVCTTGKDWQAEQFVYRDEKIEGAFEVHAFQTRPGSMASFFQDITGKHRMEEELQKIQKLESVGILAGGIAHDFNNLLTAILGNISMAKIFAGTDQVKVEERLVDAEKATLRARDLTQQLLTFARGGAPVKSAALIQDVINDSTSFMLSGSNVNCDLEIPEDIWTVDIDVGQISQVIQNLVKNADQAMPEGGTITIKATNTPIDETEVSPLCPGKYVHICIADQGAGIPEKHLTRIFDPYFSTKQEGSGLGLAASYSIIKNHDGLITAESENGNGSTFHIFLPASSKKPAVKVVQQEKSLRSGESILIMDDDEDVLNVAVNMLNLMGYKTDTARDGTEAVTKYSQAIMDGQPFDGVLLDLTIPGGMGGRETLQQLVNLDPDVKAVVSSGYANDPIMADYTTHGFQGVAIKPYDMERLGQVLRNLFD